MNDFIFLQKISFKNTKNSVLCKNNYIIDIALLFILVLIFYWFLVIYAIVWY